MPRNDGMEVVDRPDPNGPVLSWIYFVEVKENEKTYLRAMDHSAGTRSTRLNANFISWRA